MLSITTENSGVPSLAGLSVAHYVGGFFPEARGGTYAAYRLARKLRDRGAAISFIAGNTTHGLIQSEVFEEFPVHSFSFRRPGKLRKLLALAYFAAYVDRNREEIDIFHIHGGSYTGLFLGWFVKSVFRKKVLLKITSDGWDTPQAVRSMKYGRLAERFYRHSDAVVAMTSGQAEKCRSWGYRGLLATIPNGVDCQKHCPVDLPTKRALRKKLNVPADIPVLIYAGWTGYEKGTDTLFDTWRHVMKSCGRVALLCVGDFAGRIGGNDEWRVFFRDHGLGPDLLEHPDLIRLGRVHNIAEYMQASDILVFPSRQEGFGTVQIEAMACGLPCVVNDLPGVSCDIFPDDKVGFRIRNSSVADFTRVVDMLIKDSAKRDQIGAAARTRAQEKFSIDIVADRYARVYQELIS